MRFLTPFVVLVMWGLAVSGFCQTIPPPVPVPVIRLAPAVPAASRCILVKRIAPSVADSCVRGGLVEVIAPQIVQRSVEGIRVMPLTVLPRVAELTIPPSRARSASPSGGLSLPQRQTWGDRLNEVFGRKLHSQPQSPPAP